MESDMSINVSVHLWQCTALPFNVVKMRNGEIFFRLCGEHSTDQVDVFMTKAQAHRLADQIISTLQNIEVVDAERANNG
jgi:hypothetical protein